MKNILLLLLLSTLLISCSGDQFEEDIEAIENYISSNNLTFDKTEESIYYSIVESGSEVRPTLSNSVVCHYRGYYLDGEQFDSSYDRGMTSEFGLANVIEGWRIGMQLFAEGDSGTLIIPSELGYGGNPPLGIREDAVLVFDIELFEVK